MLEVCALALTALVSSQLLRELGWRGVSAFAVCVSIAVLSSVLPRVVEVAGLFSSFSSELGVDDVARDVVKIVGIGYLSGIVADVCRDMGEGSIASSVLSVGRVEMLAIAAPSFFEVIRLGMELMQ
ncbi:MAG: hypothetical protein J6Q69_07265 [Clostridia bacterium]|nr:hypothetical protein [Clostridia bacterium]